MYKIVSSRGGGRTTTLCEYAINNEKNIITPTLSSAKYILGMIHNSLKQQELNIIEEKSVSYGFYIIWEDHKENSHQIDIIVASKKDLTGLYFGNCVVDDADEVLKMLVRENLKQNVVGLTMSME